MISKKCILQQVYKNKTIDFNDEYTMSIGKMCFICMIIFTSLFPMDLSRITRDVAHAFIQKDLSFQEVSYLKQVSKGCNALYDAEKICPNFAQLSCETYACFRLSKNYYTCTKALAHFASKKQVSEDDKKKFEHLWQYHKKVRDNNVCRILKYPIINIVSLKDQMAVYRKHYTRSKDVCSHIIEEGELFISQKNIPYVLMIFMCGKLHFFDILAKSHFKKCPECTEDILSNTCASNNIEFIRTICGDCINKRSFKYVMTFASSATIYCLIEHNILPYDMVDDHKKSILHYAAEYGYETMIQLLFKKGIYVNPRDDKGMIPLHYAVKNGKLETMTTLFIQNDTDLHFKSKKGKTAFDYTKKSRLDSPDVKAGKEEIRKLLNPFMEQNNRGITKMYPNGYQKLQ